MGSNTVDAFVETDADLISIKHGEKDLEEILGYRYGEKILINKLEFKVGGSATNAAVSFSRLGHDTAYLGKIGQDNNGVKVYQTLKDEGIDFVGGSGDETGYPVILDSEYEDRTILTYKGCNNDLRFDELDMDELETDWFFFTTMMEESFRTMKILSKKLDEQDVKIAFNPSSYLATKGFEKCEPILKHVNVLILNEEEAKSLADEEDLSKTLQTLKDHVKDHVIVTSGGDGAYLYNGDEVYVGEPSDRDIVETTGAGDAFASGFISGLINEDDIETSFKKGFIQAEAVIQEYGAKTGLLEEEEINERIHHDSRDIQQKDVEEIT